tara:strand:+ start:6771 stop:9182 length:2412 start_codon:yes stop_codon:yes gene_type:complete
MSVDPKNIFEAITKPVSELLSDRGLGLYIPSYQRPYSWDKEKVNRLIEDISHGFKLLLNSEDSFTFLGTVITIHDHKHVTVQPIVRQDVPSKVLTVIDGQQRMTTLLLLCMALHNELSVVHQKYIKYKSKIEKTIIENQGGLDFGEEKNEELQNFQNAFEWLDGQTRQVIDALASTFYEKYPYGETPLYPRMIRSLDDQWSKSAKSRKYYSSIANLIATYIEQIEDGGYKPIHFKPKKRSDKNIEGEEALVDRFNQLKSLLGKLGTSNDEEIQEVPTNEEIYNSETLQLGLLNHVAPIDSIKDVSEDYRKQFDELSLLMFYANYVLSRVVVTVVQGKNEDYAFTIFESLNTTGEPLTAFETFKPRVVGSVDLENYEKSEEKALMDEISNYLSQYSAGKDLQKETMALLIDFFGAYEGIKVPRRLADQRSALKLGFETAQEDENPKKEKLRFIQTMRDAANFRHYFWDATSFNDIHKFIGNLELSSKSKLCLTFLGDLKHTIVIPILTNFFTQIIKAETIEEKQARLHDFEEALQAIVAFSVLWRASRNGTGGIDNQYRELLNTTGMRSGLPPMSRKHLKDDIINIDLFKKEMKSRLIDSDRKGSLENKKGFINKAIELPVYNINKKVAKFLLLAAHHNAVEDPLNPGLLVKGKEALNSCLTSDMYNDERNLSLEHVAPQTYTNGWDQNIYARNTLVHTLGNLILVSSTLNSSLSNRVWNEKRNLYRAVGARTEEEAKQILIDSQRNQNFDFRNSTKDVIEAQSYMPNLVALSKMEAPWTAEWIEKRSQHLYSLVWEELMPWLS